MVTMRQRVRRGGLFGDRGNRRVRPRTPAAGVPAAVDTAAGAEDTGELPRAPRLGPRLRALGAATVRLLLVMARIGCALLLAAALGGGAWTGYRAVLTSPRFMVREVVFPATHHVAREELAALAAVAPGRNIFTVDLGRVSRDLAAHPWLERVAVRRELPNRIVVAVAEREPALLAELGGLYLVARDGHVFKRAETEETAGLVVVTGIERTAYLRDRARAEARLRSALQLLTAYRAGPARPAIGEVHLEPDGGVVLYTTNGGTALRLGQGDLPAKLERFDVVWQALGPRQVLARTVHLDNRTRPDRVTLRLDPDPDAVPEEGPAER